MRKIYNYTFILLLAISACSCKNKAAPSPDNWETGTSTVLFSSYTQEEFFEFKSYGFKYLEISSANFIIDSEKELWCKKLKDKVEKAGLAIWSIHLPSDDNTYDISALEEQTRESAVRELSDIIAFGNMLDPRKYVIHSSPNIKNDNERAIRIENCIASLKLLNEEVKKQGAQLAVECLSRNCLGNTSTELLHIVNSVGNGIGICFDSNHLMQEKPEEFVKKAGELICTVHISDYEGKKSLHWLPGCGNINWANVISELIRADYHGPFMFEVKNKHGVKTVDAKALADSWKIIKQQYHNAASK